MLAWWRYANCAIGMSGCVEFMWVVLKVTVNCVIGMLGTVIFTVLKGTLRCSILNGGTCVKIMFFLGCVESIKIKRISLDVAKENCFVFKLY